MRVTILVQRPGKEVYIGWAELTAEFRAAFDAKFHYYREGPDSTGSETWKVHAEKARISLARV